MRETILALGTVVSFLMLVRWYVTAQAAYWLSEEAKKGMTGRAGNA